RFELHRSGGIMRNAGADHHLTDPGGEDISVSLLAGFAGQSVVCTFDDAMRQGSSMHKSGAVIHQHPVRYKVVVLRLHQQHVAGKFGTGSEGAVIGWCDSLAAIAGELFSIQALFGSAPVLVPVERGNAQRKPAHWTQRR